MRALPSSVNRLLTMIRNLAIAALSVALGQVYGRALVSANWKWPLSITGVTAYALIILANPLAGMVFWIVTAPFSRFIYLDIVLGRGVPDLTLTRMCAGILVVVLLAQLATGKLQAPRPSALDAAVVATLVGIGASLPASYEGLRDALTSFGDAYLVPAIIYFLARSLVRSKAQAEVVVTGLVALGTILTTVALHEQLTGTVLFVYSERSWVYGQGIHRLAGLLGSPAFFATLIAMGCGCAVYRFARAAGDRRLLYGLLALYMTVGEYYTFNRAGWLSLALNILILALAWPRFRRVFVAALAVSATALVLSWATVQRSPVITQRLSARGPIEYRLEILSRAGLILAHNPFFGLGYANFGRFYLRYNPAWTTATVLPAPHNSFLEVTFNSGLVGGIPYVTMFAIMFLAGAVFYRRARARDPSDADLVLVLLLAMLAYAVQAMVVDMISAYYVNMVMMLAVGTLFGWQTEESYASRHPGAVPARSE